MDAKILQFPTPKPPPDPITFYPDGSWHSWVNQGDGQVKCTGCLRTESIYT